MLHMSPLIRINMVEDKFLKTTLSTSSFTGKKKVGIGIQK